MKLTHRLWGIYSWSCNDESVVMARPKPQLTEFGIHHILLSCVPHFYYTTHYVLWFWHLPFKVSAVWWWDFKSFPVWCEELALIAHTEFKFCTSLLPANQGSQYSESFKFRALGKSHSYFRPHCNINDDGTEATRRYEEKNNQIWLWFNSIANQWIW